MGSLVKWGIVSTADINRKVIPGAHASEKVDLVAVASRDRARAEAYAREWEIPRAYGSYEALLADPEIEAVYISLPNTMHAEWSIKALDAGKHVLCEKPFTRHPEEVDAAFDAAERNGRLLSEAFMYRHNPQTAKLVELVRDGAIGELRLIRSAFSYGLYDHENIRLRTDVEGGALMDVGCYNVSGSRLLGGRARAGLGRGVVRAVRNGLGLQRHAALPRRRARDLRLRHCARRARRARGDRQRGLALPRRSLALQRHPVIELRRDGDVERIELDREDSYRLELENLSDAIRGEAGCCSGAKTRSARPARSRRCIAPRRPRSRSRSSRAAAVFITSLAD